MTIDGNNVLEVYEQAAKAIERARNGNGPSLVECMTYRWHGHHAGEPRDGQLYRSLEEINAWKEKDPINRLKEQLLSEKAITENDFTDWENGFKVALDEAIEFAQKSPLPHIEALYEDVYI